MPGVDIPLEALTLAQEVIRLSKENEKQSELLEDAASILECAELSGYNGVGEWLEKYRKEEK
jgi:hypothetical protein